MHLNKNIPMKTENFSSKYNFLDRNTSIFFWGAFPRANPSYLNETPALVQSVFFKTLQKFVNEVLMKFFSPGSNFHICRLSATLQYGQIHSKKQEALIFGAKSFHIRKMCFQNRLFKSRFSLIAIIVKCPQDFVCGKNGRLNNLRAVP